MGWLDRAKRVGQRTVKAAGLPFVEALIQEQPELKEWVEKKEAEFEAVERERDALKRENRRLRRFLKSKGLWGEFRKWRRERNKQRQRGN